MGEPQATNAVGQGRVGNRRRWLAVALIGAALVLEGVVAGVVARWHAGLVAEREELECRVRMRMIGMSLILHANAHGGQYPDRVADALRPDLPPVCPVGKGAYVYVTAEKAMPKLREVLLFEPLENHKGRGINVLYSDGSVEWIQGEAARGIVEGARAHKVR